MRAQPADPVLIIGGGITGIVAALELLRLGCSVILLDRDTPERFGGLARESFGGIFAVDTRLQRLQGIHDDPSVALADWTRFGQMGPADGWAYAWARAYVQDCRREVYDWLRAQGVGFLPLPQWPERRGNSVPRWHVVWGTGSRLMECLINALHRQARAPGTQAGRLDLRFGHRVEQLHFEDGRCTGAAGVREDDGTPFAMHARAVLVATGGITGTLAQIRAHWSPDAPPMPEGLLIGGHPYGDGLLHRACADHGAQLRHLDRMWNYAAGVRHWAPRHEAHGLSLVPARSALWLDAHGRPFAPPLLAGWDTSEQVERILASGGYSWQLLNRRIALRELAVSGAEFNPSLRERRPLAFARELLLGNRWLVDTLVRNCPDVLVAATTVELVQGMNALAGTDTPIDAAALHASLQDFDATRLAPGADQDAQRRSIAQARAWKGDRLRTAGAQAILDPAGGPLMAIRARLISRKSLGGIVTDLQGRVLDGRERPLAGLYAAGEASGFGGGGMNGRRALEGTFLGGCIYSARRAAQDIARASRGNGAHAGDAQSRGGDTAA